ncbi:hypothetical protein BGW42_000515 [Actinomortierella wolfii]|nr:hypothetical protein BGW42_000515 [Actinomortierella wolfii]
MWRHTARSFSLNIAAQSQLPSRVTTCTAFRAVTFCCRSSVLIPNQRLPFTTSWQTQQGFLRPGPGRDRAIAAAAEAKRARSATASVATGPASTGTRGAANGHSTEEDDSVKDEEDEEDDDDDDSQDIDDLEDLESDEGVVVIHTKNPPPQQRTAQPNQVYKEIVLRESDFRERFVKGGGNGGQKINKTNSNVELKHYETGIVVQCQATRSLPQNRKLARRILIARLDEYYNGALSKRAQKAEKIREKKRRAARKSAKKYAAIAANKVSADPHGQEEGSIPSTSSSNSNSNNVMSGAFEPLDLTKMTLEEILAMDNKKPSRRKAKK